LSTDKESTGDNAVVCLSVNGKSSEKVLAGSLKSVEETTNEVGCHKDERKLVVVLVINLPERVLFWLIVLPEPRKGDRSGLLVGVLPLPVIESEGSLGEKVKGVLGLWLGCGKVLFFLFLNLLLLLDLGAALGASFFFSSFLGGVYLTASSMCLNSPATLV
jgi:hypothetical protein